MVFGKKDTMSMVVGGLLIFSGIIHGLSLFGVDLLQMLGGLQPFVQGAAGLAALWALWAMFR